MNPVTIAVVLAAVATASAGAIGVPTDIHAYPAYKTSYSVADKLTGDQKSAVEVRDGAVTKGSYSLVQPDGIIREVNYIVTPKGGFQAQVINKGVAGHPAIVGIGKGIGAVAAPGLALETGRIGFGGAGLLGASSVVGGLGGLNGGVGLGLGGAGLSHLGIGVGRLGPGLHHLGLGIGGAGLGGVGLGLGGAGLGLGAGIIG